MINFIGPLIMLSGVASFIGIVIGLIKKNKKILIPSLVVFLMIVALFMLEGLFFE